MGRKSLEAQLDYFSEILKRVERVKANCFKTVDDCDKLIEDINMSIAEVKSELTYDGGE